MRWLYNLAWYLLLPLVLLRLLYKSLGNPAYRQGVWQRLGVYSGQWQGNGVWCHAVSVGEVHAVAGLLNKLLAEHPATEITVTTMTPTGAAALKRLFGQRVRHVYVPYDCNFAVHGFMGKVKPRKVIIVETELWPNLLGISKAYGAELYMVNARLSAKSHRGYGRIKPLIAQALCQFDGIAAQFDADAQRLIDLGAIAQHVHVTGSVKFDVARDIKVLEAAQQLRQSEPHLPRVTDTSDGQVKAVKTIVAASTHRGEDEIILKAFAELNKSNTAERLIIVPRHPERFAEVAQLVESHGFTLQRRSQQPSFSQAEVYLVDTMGELPILLAASDLAFFGGSLVPVGGHNILEGFTYQVPVVFGPHMHNFTAIAQMALDLDAAYQVNQQDGLAAAFAELLNNDKACAAMVQAATELMASQRGALERQYAMLNIAN